MLCSPCQPGTKYENRSFTWMFISFHHCGELVGEPMIADGKSSCTQWRVRARGRLSMAEKPARISFTAREPITHVSPSEKS